MFLTVSKSALKPVSSLAAQGCQQIRCKTFRKTLTKAFKKRQAWIQSLKDQGLPLPAKPEGPVMENKFWKVVGPMKVYKSVSPGSTHRRHPTRFHLHKGTAVKRLSVGKRSTGGRNITGRITVRHRGGGHKKRYRFIDWHRSVSGSFQVVRLEYDPNRTAEICLMRCEATNEFTYMVRPQTVQPGDVLYSYRGDELPEHLSKVKLMQPGNCFQLKNIPVGTNIHCIGLRPDGPAQLCRAAGTSATLMFTAESGFAQVKLSSGEVRLIDVRCCATIGEVANEHHIHRNLGKAGASRRLGRRPVVRGIAMNANAHPHGGGKKSKGNKHPRSIWGWKTKGVRLRRKRWFIVKPKWASK